MKSDKKNILICGNYGVGNLGDEAILDGILKLCQTSQRKYKVYVLSSSPEQTKRYHSTESVYLFPAGLKSFVRFWIKGKFRQTLKAVRHSHLAIIGGGGLFADEKWQAVWIWTVQVFCLRLLGCSYICIAQSVGPLNTKLGRFLTSFVFRHAKSVTVRDSQSADILRKLGVKNIQCLGDAAFAIGFDVPKAKNIQDYVVLSLRNWSLSKSQKSDNFKKWQTIANIIDELWVNKALKTLFVPFQINQESDKIVFKKIQKLVKNKSAFKMQEVDDYRHALEVISRGRFVLGMRLHSIIFATFACRPFIGISYSDKVSAMAKELSMEQYCIDFEKISSVKKINELIDLILTNEKEIIATLERKKLQLTYSFFEHEKILQSLL